MAITPLEQYGTIGRTQDFSTIKQQEENKMLGSQTVIQSQVEKNAEKIRGLHARGYAVAEREYDRLMEFIGREE